MRIGIARPDRENCKGGTELVPRPGLDPGRHVALPTGASALAVRRVYQFHHQGRKPAILTGRGLLFIPIHGLHKRSV